MSTAVVSTSAALGRPFLFDDESEAEVRSSSPDKKPSAGQQSPIAKVFQSTINNLQSSISSFGNRQSAIENFILPASHLEIRPAPEMVTSGIPALDALTGGLPRGGLTEICGSASSGRTSVMLAALAAATRRGEYCAVIDASDALDPYSLTAAGIDLDHLLWVRCGEQSPRRHPSTSLGAGCDTEKTNREKNFITQNVPNQVTVGMRTVRNDRIEKDTSGKGTASAVPYRPHTDTALAAEGHGFHLQQQSLFKQTATDRIAKNRASRNDFNDDLQNRKLSEYRLEQVLRATDLLLESGGFGLITLDLADVPHQAARRIPLATWFRFRRAVEHKPTILLAIEQQPIAGSCSSLLLRLEVLSSQFSVLSANRNFAKHDAAQDIWPAHTELLTKLEIQAELIRSRLERKPARPIAFAAKTAWAG